MGPIVENSSPGTPQLFLTPPEGEIEAEGTSSGTEADMEEVEDPLQDELNSPAKETEGYSIDPWPEIDGYRGGLQPATRGLRKLKRSPARATPLGMLVRVVKLIVLLAGEVECANERNVSHLQILLIETLYYELYYYGY